LGRRRGVNADLRVGLRVRGWDWVKNKVEGSGMDG